MLKYPPIKIKPNTSPHVFVERLHEIASGLDEYQCEMVEQDDQDTMMIKLQVQDIGPKELEIRIISAKHTDVKHVHVRMNTPEWKNDIPEYTDYTALCKEALAYLLKEYNRIHKSRLRLIVKNLDTLQPDLTPKIQMAFNDFESHAHRDVLGGRDWERFYRFIRLTHAFQVRLDEEQIFFLLTQAGFDRQYAREISDVYMHGRALLANK